MKIAQLFKRLFHRKLSHQTRRYKGLYLPLARSNEGLSGDQEYVNSAVEQVDDLMQFCELKSNMHILDFGCGQGRLANGLLVRAPNIGCYYGIDTNEESINWCKRWIQRYHSNFSFIHVAAHNARYNPSVNSRPELPAKANSFDVAFLNSVFSHMLTDDVQFYLTQLHGVLRIGGIIYVTAFIEKDVPPVEENPVDYLGRKSTGALHRVRYEKSFFLGLVENAGFSLVSYINQKIERTKQTVVVARKIA